jgi:hypothetical protein
MDFQKTPIDYSHNPKKYEFKTFLTTLVGGHGGSTKFSNKPLFFNYATQYHYFMKILQDETQLSTIPPLGLEKSQYITPEVLKQRLTQREESRGSIERGYTVLDGPWLYRIRKNNQVQKATYEKVGDEASYRRMLDTLNGANKKDPTAESALVFVHVSTFSTLF